MAEEDLFAKLQARFGATLAGINDTSTLQEALIIANRVTEEETLEYIPRDRDDNMVKEISPAKYDKRTGDLIKEALTPEKLVAQQQEPQLLLGLIISAFIREQMSPTESE